MQQKIRGKKYLYNDIAICYSSAISVTDQLVQSECKQNEIIMNVQPVAKYIYTAAAQ